MLRKADCQNFHKKLRLLTINVRERSRCTSPCTGLPLFYSCFTARLSPFCQQMAGAARRSGAHGEERRARRLLGRLPERLQRAAFLREGARDDAVDGCLHPLAQLGAEAGQRLPQ